MSLEQVFSASAFDILTLWARRSFVVGDVLCIVGCFAVFLVPTHQMSVAPFSPVVITNGVSRHSQISMGTKFAQLRTTALES